MVMEEGEGRMPHVSVDTKKKLVRGHLRDRSWRLLCSLRLKARLQYWHLYFFSGAFATFRGEVLVLAGAAAVTSVC